MHKRVSIIMGIYNCASTLETAIESILQQTYHDWELIICDDGSEDDTYDIALKFSKKYENIIVFRNAKNMGLNYTLNKCLDKATGEYVARMDGDDISLPTRLEKEVEFLDVNKEYEIVSTNMVYFDEQGEWGKSNMIAFPQKDDLIKGTPFCHAPCMVRREAYIKVNGYSVEKRLLRVEDYHLWFKMYSEGYKGHNLEEVLYKMRDDRNAIQRRRFKYRLNESYVKRLVMKQFDLPLNNIIYIAKPIIVGLAPQILYERIHKRRILSRDDERKSK